MVVDVGEIRGDAVEELVSSEELVSNEESVSNEEMVSSDESLMYNGDEEMESKRSGKLCSHVHFRNIQVNFVTCPCANAAQAYP